MEAHRSLCCRYIVVSMQRRGFPPPRVLCPMVSSMGNASAPSMRRLSTVQKTGGKCAPVDGIDQCRSISSRQSSCSAPCSSNDCTRTLPRLLRMRSREIVVLILHYLFCGEAFPPPLCLPARCTPPVAEDSAAPTWGESPSLGETAAVQTCLARRLRVLPRLALLCEKRARVNAFDSV